MWFEQTKKETRILVSCNRCTRTCSQLPLSLVQDLSQSVKLRHLRLLLEKNISTRSSNNLFFDIDMAQSTASLRALAYRLTSTPTQQLPAITPQIAAALWNCKDILSLSTDSKASGEAATAVHRFKVCIILYSATQFI